MSSGGEGVGSERDRGFRKNFSTGEIELPLFGCCEVLFGCWG